MFLWDRGVARNPWLLVPDPENCSARLLVAPNALEFSFPLCPVASNGSCCPQHFHSRAPNVHPSVRPSISVHPSLYNGKDLHAQQVTLIIAVGIATYCQHIATHSESPRFFPFKSRNPGITNNILNHTHQNHGNGKFPNGKARLRYPEPRWLGEHHGTQWSIQRYHRSYSSLLNKGTGKTSILLG